MYTIFINDAVIYLTDDYDLKTKEHFFRFHDIDLEIVLKKLENSVLQWVYLYANDLDALFENFKSDFQLIEASGGLVFNEHKEVLWIYRNGRWDLPKGKIEKGESKEIAGIREVEEECGLRNIRLQNFITTTYHIYEIKQKRILKVTYWYRMYADHQLLTPQVDEGITKAVWLNEESMEKAIDDTYGTIKLLFNA